MISTVYGVFEFINGHFELVDYFDHIRPALVLLDELRSNNPQRYCIVERLHLDLDTDEVIDYGYA